jgi:hypothetical protein
MGTPCHKNDIISIKKKIDDYTSESRVFLDLLRFLTIGIRALSLAGVVGNYFLFLQIFFFSEKKKEGRDIPDIFSIFL